MSKTLSICLITKNEEKNLVRCVDSVKNIADEIIVVDTGSSDNTIALAQQLGAKVFNYIWVNDFSKARNFALDKCTKDWIFVIDGDEALEINHDKLLKNFLDKTDKEALYMTLNNIIGTTIINQNPTLRIFRNNKNYRYKNKIHEQIVDSISSCGTNLFDTINIVLNHYGYDHNVVDMDSKSKRNIEILTSYSEDERDSIYYFGLGNEYMKLGKTEEAKKYLVKSLDYKDNDQGVLTYAAASIIQCCIQLEDYASGLNYANHFIKIYRDFKDLYFLKSACCGYLMKYSDSYIALSIFNSLPQITSKYPSFSFGTNNDLPNLMINLVLLKIYKPENFLTTIIEISNIDSNYKNTILNCNEISDEVFIINNSDIIDINCYSSKLGAIPFEIGNKSLADLNNFLIKESKCKWILYLTENQTLNHTSRNEIINALSQNKIPPNYKIIKNF